MFISMPSVPAEDGYKSISDFISIALIALFNNELFITITLLPDRYKSIASLLKLSILLLLILMSEQFLAVFIPSPPVASSVPFPP